MKKCLPVLFFLLISALLSLTIAQTGWFEQTNPLGFGEQAMIGKVQFVSPAEGWIACGNGGLLHTTNGGEVWNFINPFPDDTVGRMSDPAVSMCWVGTTHGWVIGGVGGESNPHGGIIFSTTNGGVSWSKTILPNTPGDVGFQIQFVDTNNGWLLCFNFNTWVATPLKTTDGGNNWFPYTGAGIFYFVDANNGWSFIGSGTNGQEPPFKILRTTNGGTDWTEQFTDSTPGAYNAIHFSDIDNGWVVGNNGKVLHTNNGGTSWNFVLNTGVNTGEKCKAVFFLDADTGWLASKDENGFGIIQHTTDGGGSWTTQTTPLNNTQGGNSIFSIHFFDAQNGCLTGDYGKIAKYTGTTSVENENISPSKFNLTQNWPNPFNSSTAIKYSIPQTSDVKLKVYDILGNEVTTLVNEEKEQGTYTINFDLNNLASGLYLYRIQTGSFIKTKKMILLK